jgi:hypothetical protein
MASLFNSSSFVLTVLALFTAVARAQTPVGDLAKPPADAEHLIISSTGGKHGDSWIWQTPDGTRMGRESLNLRGQVFETDCATKLGADGLPTSVTRADYRASWAKMVQLLTRMYKAGVPIVSGTDGSGIEIIRELEVYHEAGLTNAEALAAATITPARLLNVDKKTGSIEVGKAADLVLVEGDPSERLSDLRQTRVVMLDGKLMDATRCAVPQDSPAGRSRLSDW